MADTKNSGLSPVFPKEDAARPEFWEKRFRPGFTPWDSGGIPLALESFLGREPRGARVLIPGCGSGYEVRAFVQAGFETLAIDFAPAAVERAQRTLGPLAHLVRLADFFEFDFGRSFDLIYERTFLCALPRRLWPRCGCRSSCGPKEGSPDFSTSTTVSADRPLGSKSGSSKRCSATDSNESPMPRLATRSRSSPGRSAGRSGRRGRSQARRFAPVGDADRRIR